MENTMKRVRLLVDLYRENARHFPGDTFKVVDPPITMQEDYPNGDQSAWVELDNGHKYRLTRQKGYIQFEFINE